MCLVAWPLNESEASVDFVSIETLLLSTVNDTVLMLIILVGIYIRKAFAFLSKQGQLQPYFYSKARQLSAQILF